MLFSIIVPIYNVEAYLDKCVSSIRNQTLSDLEIILVDDGSPDRCPQMCDDYSVVDSRIHVVHKVNGGLSDARNAGLEVAHGEYVLFVDSDDYIAPDTCERFSEWTKKGIDILIGDAILEGGFVNIGHIAPSDEVYSGQQYLLKSFQEQKDAPMAVWLNAYRRAFLEEHGLRFKYGILHEDEEFTPRAFMKAETVICTGIPFYHYVIRGGSISTRKDKRKNANDLYATCEELQVVYEKIHDPTLRKYLLDSLAVKYLNMFQVGKLYQYGKEYLHKNMVWRNAQLPKTRAKAILYCTNVRLYYFINWMTKNEEK